MTRSRFLIRQSIPPVVVTRTRRGTVVELIKQRTHYVRFVIVLAVMLGCLASVAWQLANQPQQAIPIAEVEEREAKAFQAGRETAYEELSQGVADVYAQGVADGRAAASGQARAGGGVQ